ncbi:polar amino acid ABC transporter, inner membrane subunit [Pseudodesulfovibrio mercurii]|uniref:Polar amino acid ABC transporter, inner membrane subunit n=1 Tax=Pseudodesulfovibrio mercurii TaxID=641491 RepID=F0JE27_9BACT|nr:amino acid ABC transporter permease [Pseudodesulfovibrio mercurii]EGB14636.1 polar amino acid ABC transporter, inner membrane subunit [Pseudodesulfovibrio mercurii]
MFDVSIILEYYPLFLKGLVYTVLVCAAGILGGLAWGLVLYAAGRANLKFLRAACRLYVNIFRGTPLLVQLFLLFYGGPLFGLRLSAIATGILGLAAYGGAYFAEIYRAGFQSIPPGQIEAARDLGLSRWQIVRHIQLPQMLTLILPPLTNQAIIIVKESAILSIITVPELTTAAVKVSTTTFSIVEPYLLLAAAYWLIVQGISMGGRAWEARQMVYLARQPQAPEKP